VKIASALLGALALCRDRERRDRDRIAAIPAKFHAFVAAMRQKLIAAEAG
jgi:hypothetical protein